MSCLHGPQGPVCWAIDCVLEWVRRTRSKQAESKECHVSWAVLDGLRAAQVAGMLCSSAPCCLCPCGWAQALCWAEVKVDV